MGSWPLAQTDITQANQPDALTSSEYGELAVASATPGVKGTWKEMHAGIPFDAAGVLVQLGAANQTAHSLVDIGIGASTAEVVLIPNLGIGAGRTDSYGSGTYFPIRIAKGTRVSARCQSSVASTNILVNTLFFGGGWNADWVFQRVTAYNIDTSSNSVPNSIDPGGSANTFTSWTQASSSTIGHMRAIVVACYQGNAATTLGNWMVDVGVRVGGVDTALIPGITFRTDVNYDQMCYPAVGPLPINVPPGSDLRFRVKSTVTDTTDRVVRVGFWGID